MEWIKNNWEYITVFILLMGGLYYLAVSHIPASVVGELR